MHIVIAGDNSISRSLAIGLVQDTSIEVTLIDSDHRELKRIRENYDINSIEGQVSDFASLEAAKLSPAHVFIAVSSDDHENLVACQLAGALYGVTKTVARLHQSQMNKIINDRGDVFNVEKVLCPEETVVEYIGGVIDHPGAFQCITFKDGVSALIGVKVYENSIVVHKALRDFPRIIPDFPMRCVALYRGEGRVKLKGRTTIEVDDDLFILTRKEHVDSIIALLHGQERQVSRVMISGGGRVGAGLAMNLQDKYQTKLIEVNPQRCEQITDKLDKCIILNNNGTDRELLESEYIEDMDVFCALTNDDEANLLSSMMAKQMGANLTIALIENSAYMSLVEGQRLDIVINPALLMQSELIEMINPSLNEGYKLRRMDSEIVELSVEAGATAVGKLWDNLPGLSTAITLQGVLRGQELYLDTGNIILQEDDNLVLSVHGTIEGNWSAHFLSV